jgi:hypothetical protein
LIFKARPGVLTSYQQSYPQNLGMAGKTSKNQALTAFIASSLEQNAATLTQFTMHH